MTEENKEPNWDTDSIWRRTEEAVEAAEGDTDFLVEEVSRIAKEYNLPYTDELEEMLKDNLEAAAESDGVEELILSHGRSLSLLMKQQIDHSTQIIELTEALSATTYLLETLMNEGAKSANHFSTFCRNLRDKNVDAVDRAIWETIGDKEMQQ